MLEKEPAHWHKGPGPPTSPSQSATPHSLSVAVGLVSHGVNDNDNSKQFPQVSIMLAYIYGDSSGVYSLLPHVCLIIHFHKRSRLFLNFSHRTCIEFKRNPDFDFDQSLCYNCNGLMWSLAVEKIPEKNVWKQSVPPCRSEELWLYSVLLYWTVWYSNQQAVRSTNDAASFSTAEFPKHINEHNMSWSWSWYIYIGLNSLNHEWSTWYIYYY